MLDVLRPGVLEELTLCVVGDGVTERERAAALGARVVTVDGDLADEDAVAVAVGALGHIDVLVVDAASAFVAAGGGMAGLRRAVDDGWNVVRAVVNASWVSEGESGGGPAERRQGRLPRPGPRCRRARQRGRRGAGERCPDAVGRVGALRRPDHRGATARGRVGR